MPARPMPPLGTAFCEAADKALVVIQGLEILKGSVAAGSSAHLTLSPTRLEYTYEAAFLRIFTQWEVLLEEAAIRYMCGYTLVQFQPTFPAGVTKQKDIIQARGLLLGGRPFALWHKATKNADRVAKWVDLCPVETVMRSSATWLDSVSSIRHRIAHSSDDARQKFDSATLALAGRRFRGGSPGRFLRGIDVATGGRRIDRLISQLKNLALQVAP